MIGAAAMRRVLAVALVVGVAASCGSGEATGIDPDNLPYGELPLSALAAEALSLIGRTGAVADEAAAACMRRHGFEYPIDEINAQFDDSPPPPNINPFGEAPPLTLQRAEAFGYHIPEFEAGDAEQPGAERLMDEYLDSLGPQGRAEWERAMYGTETVTVKADNGEEYGGPADGCLAEGWAAVAGDRAESLRWDAAANVIFGLRADAMARAEQDDEMVATVGRWSACMAEAGYVFQTPFDTVDWALERRSGRDGEDDGFLQPSEEDAQKPSSAAADGAAGSIRVSDEERALAVADAQCREQVGYQETFDRLASYYENVVTVDNESVLLAWNETAEAMRTAINAADGE